MTSDPQAVPVGDHDRPASHRTAADVSRPVELYETASLLGEWTPTDSSSYAATLDGRTYLRACVEGLRAPESDDIALARALHDTAITRLLHRHLIDRACEPVAIMGGHAAPTNSDTYRVAAQLAGRLASTGVTVLSGGGPGAMEAAHLGARLRSPDRIDAGIRTISADVEQLDFPLGPRQLVRDGAFDETALRRLHAWQAPAFALAADSAGDAGESIGIPTWLYGHEPPTPLATHHAKYFENSIREDGLLALATHGAIYLPGSAGTLQEIFQDLAQNHYRTVRGVFSPMVFFDIDGYWSQHHPVRPVVESLLRPQDRDLVLWTDDIDDAVVFLDQFAIPEAPMVTRSGQP